MRWSEPLLIAFCASLATCGPPKAVPASEVIAHLDRYLGKPVVIEAKFRSGARCRQNTPDHKWQAYCKDCQFCRGPVVLDVPVDPAREELDDWPLILGGTWKGRDIRCLGPLNEIDCYPFVPGKRYVVRGKIEHQRPPKLLVEDFWEVGEATPPRQ